MGTIYTADTNVIGILALVTKSIVKPSLKDICYTQIIYYYYLTRS